jgi:DNA-binding XRE family transcriptional regulator
MVRKYVRDVTTLADLQAHVTSGLTHVEIGDLYELDPKTISAYLTRHGIYSLKENPHRGKLLKIRTLRLGRGECQKEVAESVGITQQAVSQHERGIKQPTVKALEAYAEHFGVDINELFVEKKG